MQRLVMLNPCYCRSWDAFVFSFFCISFSKAFAFTLWIIILTVCLLPTFLLATSLCHCPNNWLLQMSDQGFLLDSTVSLDAWELMYFLLGIVCAWMVFLVCSSSYILGHWNYFTLLLFSLWENCNRLSCKCVLMLACGFMYSIHSGNNMSFSQMLLWVKLHPSMWLRFRVYLPIVP